MARGQLSFEGGDEPAAEAYIDEALAAVGLYLEEPIVIEEEYWLWPKNAPVFWLWCALQTQWQYTSEGTRLGLCYTGVEVVMKMRGVPAKKQREYFSLIQAMEHACLSDSNS